jgi:hypothetical protein
MGQSPSADYGTITRPSHWTPLKLAPYFCQTRRVAVATGYMEQSPSWQADSHSASQIPRTRNTVLEWWEIAKGVPLCVCVCVCVCVSDTHLLHIKVRCCCKANNVTDVTLFRSGVARCSSSVSIVTTLRAGWLGFNFWRGNYGIYSLCHCVQTGCGVHLTSNPMGTGGETASIPPPTLFMAWYLVQSRDNFTFTFIRWW